MKFSILNSAIIISLMLGVLLTSCSTEKEAETDISGDGDVSGDGNVSGEEEDFSNYVWNQQGETIDIIYGASMDFNSTGDKIIVGSAGSPNACSNFCDGVVRVYDFINGIWTQINNDLYGSSSGSNTDFIGFDVAINNDGNFIATSYYGFGFTPGNHKTRVYQNVNGDWVQVGQDLPYNTGWSDFGHNISINAEGNILAIARPTNRQDTLIKLYKLNSNNEWIQIGEDINPGYGSNEAQVDLNAQGNILAVGEYNILRIGGNIVDFYEITENGWNHINQMRDTYNGENISADIDLSSDGSTIILAGYTQNDCNSNICIEPPQISVYERVGSEWNQKGQSITWEEEGYNINNEQAVAINQDGKGIAIGLKRSDVNYSYVNETFVLTFQYSETEKKWKQMQTIEMGRESNEVWSLEFNDEGNMLAVGIGEFIGKRVKVFKFESL